jgi:alpha-glucosidase
MNPLAVLLAGLLPVAGGPFDVAAFDRGRVLAAADRYLREQPVTITASRSPRSAGGPHDFFSEADYWWPDPQDPGGPYVQRDGMTNPDNFVEHRRALMRLSVQVPALAAAWRLTGARKYSDHAVRHLRAWFVEPETRMHPHLRYAQAIHGRVTGRGIGIIDTIHLVEVARALEVLRASPSLRPADRAAIHAWFAEYLAWMTTHEYGIAEREAKNNHGTCWLMQVAAFARLLGREDLLVYGRERFKTVLVPNQMAPDGSFPLEMRRTKPYGYALFQLDALATVAELLSTPGDDLWRFELPDGRGLRKAVAFMVPSIRDRKAWPLPPDVMYDAEWPMRHPSLFFAGRALGMPEYLDLWKTLKADSTVEEVVRNFFVRQPVLWVDPPSRSRAQGPTGRTVELRSPSRRVRLAVEARAGRLSGTATLDGHPAIDFAPLGLQLDGVDLGAGARIVAVDRHRVREDYAVRGVKSRATSRGEGARVTVRTAAGIEYALDARAFDDGVAFRFVVPGRAGERRVPDAGTAFRLPAGSVVWKHDLEGHYEGVHEAKAVEEVAAGAWAAPPLTARLPGGHGYVAVTEAALLGYAGMALQADGRGAFAERLGHAHPPSYPFTLRYGQEEATRLAKPAALDGTITTPWRVVMIAADLNGLVNNDLVTSLAPPPDPGLFPRGIHTEWLRPGRAVWKYLDGGESSLAVTKEFSRLARELGFEHQVVEGFWRQWSAEDLKDLVASSAKQGVGIWLWVHSRDLRDAAARETVMKRATDAGAVGLKVDFLDHEAQEVVAHYEVILRAAAERRLMVNFHGANKPAGEARTWPNEMTREAVTGLERRRIPAWARHNTTLPFTRFLAGHGDYTPVIFGDRRKETSVTHQVATAAVFTSPLLVYGAHPSSLLESPAVEMIRSIPSTWDETVVLPPSAIGELAVFARRAGATWFLAVLNGPEARTLRVPLRFLAGGVHHALVVRDVPGEAAAMKVEEAEVRGTDAMEMELRAGGGFIARLRPRGAK